MSYLAQAQGTFINLPPVGVRPTFMMGSTVFNDAQPIRTITLTPFAMQQTPVTVEQFSTYIEQGEQPGLRYGRFIYGPTGHVASVIWGDSEKAIGKKTLTLDAGRTFASVSPIRQLIPTMDEYRSRFADFEDGGELFLKPNHPAVMLDWYEAAAFAFSIGGRLPTEAEHEFAARAGREGDEIYGTDTCELTAENAHWDHDGSVYGTAPVKSHAPNPWDLYDMAGNVWEWTQSWYAGSLEALSEHDPVGPLDGKYRVVRGGSWDDGDRQYLLAAYRYYGYGPVSRSYRLGLRVVRSQDS